MKIDISWYWIGVIVSVIFAGYDVSKGDFQKSGTCLLFAIIFMLLMEVHDLKHPKG